MTGRRSDSPLRTRLDHDGFPATRRQVIGDLLRRLDRSFSGRCLGKCHVDEDGGEDPPPPPYERPGGFLGDGAPQSGCCFLLTGCLLGLATGLCVAMFNRGVHEIHEWARAGAPNDGASWLRSQRLEDTWHRMLLTLVTGGGVVGMLHGLLEISYQLKPPKSLEDHNIDWISGIFPIIKAIQVALSLGTGCSVGPEGPSVDIGNSCARGCLLFEILMPTRDSCETCDPCERRPS